jgi:hypothetical protein
MPQELCTRGRELFFKASQADDLFKARLLEFFSRAKKDDREMKQIEVLGEIHREADEAFHRHKGFCATCAEAPVVILRYATAE